MSKFNVGTRVHLREDSEWFGDPTNNPASTDIHGTVIDISCDDDEGLDYQVAWDAGTFSSFKPGTCDWKDSLVQRPEGV